MNSELYSEFFGLTERPFKLLPDPDFLYWSSGHKKAFAVLEYGIVTRAPLTVVTGEVGTGKTTLVQHMLNQMEDDMVVGLISNAQGGRGDLLRWILHVLDVEVVAGDDYVSMFQKFQDFVIGCYSQGRHVILIIDEAQNLSIELLEELRMLTNINSNKDELLQLILVGQPELRRMIQLPELRQFAQRVAVTYHLKPMDEETTLAYIRHRLQRVGGSGDEFTPDAVTEIFRNTRGIPRLINKLCDVAMLYAMTEGNKTVTQDQIKEIIDEELFMMMSQPDEDKPLVLSNPLATGGEAAE